MHKNPQRPHTKKTHNQDLMKSLEISSATLDLIAAGCGPSADAGPAVTTKIVRTDRHAKRSSAVLNRSPLTERS